MNSPFPGMDPYLEARWSDVHGRLIGLITDALQPLIEHAYAAGGHDDIDYGKPADPPLQGDDAVWADQLLKAAGRRQVAAHFA